MESLASFLTDLGSVFTALFGYVETVFDFVITNPIALTFIGIGFAGAVLGFALRIIRAR